MKVYLETRRMILREFTWEDVDHLVELDSDPAVMRYINGGTPTPREVVVEKFMPRILAYYDDLDRQGLWAVLDKRDGAFMGWFHLRPDRRNPQETELGYRFKQAYWGQGYATEGSLALVKKGFEELGSTRISAIADPANKASRRVMEKVGLSYRESYPMEDGFVVVYYAMDRHEYFGGQSETGEQG